MSYANLRTTASNLLTKKGKAVALQRETQGDYDPLTGGYAVILSNITGVGVFARYRKDEVDGSNILRSDRKLIYSGTEPQVNDRYGDERVVDSMPIDPDESGAIIYLCQLRK